MASAISSFGEFNLGGIDDKFMASKRLDDFVDEFDNPASSFEFYPGKSFDEEFLFTSCQQQEEQQNYQDSQMHHGLFDGLMLDVASPTLQTCLDEISSCTPITCLCDGNKVEEAEHKKEKPVHLSLASLELLKHHTDGLKRLDKERIIEPSSHGEMMNFDGQKKQPSLEDIIRFAGVKFIQAGSTSSLDHLSHPFGLFFSGLSDEDIKNVQLVELILMCAEKVSYQQYDRTKNLLNQCSYLFSKKGTPVQRLLYYFAESLRDRIDCKTGRITAKDLEKRKDLELELPVMSPTSSRIAFHQQIPFNQVSQLAGIQAIVENVTNAVKIHVIDLCIGSGAQWTILMQALITVHDCKLELLKITTVGTTSKGLIEETGKRLSGFAQSMNIPFSFNLVMVDDILDLTEDDFGLDLEETVVVYSQYFLRNFISQPHQLESVMKVIRRINPCVMVVSEVEANHNCPNFVNRFIEALFFYGVHFDCLESCMDREDENRLVVESFYFGQGIRNIMATEGEDRKVRNVKIDVWRAFFARFGMVEAELSASSLYQGRLVTKRFKNGTFCTLDMNGECLLIGWKNTPVHSLSVWKFT